MPAVDIDDLDALIVRKEQAIATARRDLVGLDKELETLRRVRALLDRAKTAWDTVPAGDLSDEIQEGADPRPLEPPSRPLMRPAYPEHRSRPAAAEPAPAGPAPRIEWGSARGRVLAYMEARRGGVGVTEAARALGISKNTVSLVMQDLLDKGLAARTGPQRGPGVQFRLTPPAATAAPPAAAVPDPGPTLGLPKLPAQNAAPVTLPVATPPLPRAEDLRWDNVRPAGQPSRDAEYLKINMVLDELAEAGDRGIAPSKLREAIGVEIPKFDALMARLLDKQVVSKVPRDDGSGKTYVLRLTGAALREYRAGLT